MDDNSMSRPDEYIDGDYSPDCSALELPPTPTAVTPAYVPRSKARSYVIGHADNYPECVGGDVIITSPTGRKWKLHSLYLTNASPHFRNLFNNNAPGHIKKKDQNHEDGLTSRWNLWMPKEPQAKDIDRPGYKFRTFEVLVSYSSSSLFSTSMLRCFTAPMYQGL